MRYFLLFAASVIVLASCQKTPTPTQSREDVLRSGTWRMTSATIIYKEPYDTLSRPVLFGYTWLNTRADRQRSQNVVTLPNKYITDTCRWDDYMKFGLNNTAAYFGAAMKCNIAEPDSSSFTWYLSNGGNNINFVNNNYAFANNNIQATITDFGANSFTIQYNEIYSYIDSPLYINAAPITHDTVWTKDTVYYKVTYGH